MMQILFKILRTIGGLLDNLNRVHDTFCTRTTYVYRLAVDGFAAKSWGG